MNYNVEDTKKGSAEYENMKASIIDNLKDLGYNTKQEIAKGAKYQLDELMKPAKVKKGGSKELIPLMKTYYEIYQDIITEYSKVEKVKLTADKNYCAVEKTKKKKKK